jgi:primosomal protein N' (replication factor Y)
MPKVELIDMKDEIKHNHKVLSRVLISKINDRLKNNEQVILLLNRRGYSTVITCHNCGFTDKCPNCDIPLIYHQSSDNMRCHYCGYTHKKLSICPECKSNNINQFGMGTEKLEEYVKNSFPSARIVRMDIDTTSKKNAHANIINDFMDHKYDILIGTQMISKGLDFPNVTLVGVLNGDATLNIPDFRSAERTFQLLNQVAGRSGRGLVKGEVIFQAFNIEHYSIIKASTHDYIGFYNEELKIRNTLKYPPYYNLCLIKISSKDYDEVVKEANKISTYLRNEISENIILGPSSASMPKINNMYYLQIIIKYKKTDNIINVLHFINNQYRTDRKVLVDIDLNPYRM